MQHAGGIEYFNGKTTRERYYALDRNRNLRHLFIVVDFRRNCVEAQTPSPDRQKRKISACSTPRREEAGRGARCAPIGRRLAAELSYYQRRRLHEPLSRLITESSADCYPTKARVGQSSVHRAQIRDTN
ncbi:hypothetical protein EYF80_038171 [Liparis tanakae]|uniref:Uncharacterized protein n=1 Tax=Liparis tanakae TaxID=230148 RepID=A0A4Z2GEK8_9TELE|nr:hypothetical protein EYF80_038171 [Liparis tanakae]